ncbi:hypothetical protein CQ018_16520 [Arthrobacter sp. MYb227]|uniref:hypothetical protein n=1 Tax=Arthrobacter sp. MYb227 TaxID=1848601 RepID=UPI000CFDBA73|nr:hypothetical protein [Arthrobacter sp. MYb227]PQZ88596.1 hypothetical protein CQ018_16520 [Arthrobacter sp. MYb227]
MTVLSLEESNSRLQAATNTLTELQDKIATVEADQQKANGEVTRLTALIATGDRQAMSLIVDAQAQADGLIPFLATLKRGLAGAQHVHEHAFAVDQRNRAVHRDVEGLLSPEQITALWAGLAEQVDALHFPVLDKLKAHEEAIQILGSLVTESNKVLGTNSGFETCRESAYASARVTSVLIDGELIKPTYPSQDSDDAVKKSGDRYRAPEIEAREAAANAERKRMADELARIEASNVYPEYKERKAPSASFPMGAR